MEPTVATITVSDSRTSETDSGGALLRKLLKDARFNLGTHAIVRDDIDDIQRAVRAVAGVDAVVLTGGTGIGPRDVTVEAVEPLFVRKLEGFGEAFRRLSWDQVGARAVLSRATAGTIGSTLVFVLPGSPKAVTLGVETLVVPLLQHAMHMITGGGHDHHGR
jgi:molybdenum cofactor biosynthesis protein B